MDFLFLTAQARKPVKLIQLNFSPHKLLIFIYVIDIFNVIFPLLICLRLSIAKLIISDAGLVLATH